MKFGLKYWFYAAAMVVGSISFSSNAQISAEQTLSIGKQLMDSEDYALAVQYLGKTVQAKPYLSEPYYLRGLAKMMLGDYAGARADCSEAITLNSYKRDPYRVRGLCLMQLGEDSLALNDFKAGLALHPDDRTFLYYTAISMAKTGNTDESLNTFSKLERLYPHFVQGYTAHARSLLAMGDTLSALGVLSKAPAKAANSPEPTLLRARIAICQNHWPEALRELDNAIRLIPHNDALYVDRGVARHHLGDTKGAISDFRTALDLNPYNSRAMSNLEGKIALSPLPELQSDLISSLASASAPSLSANAPCGMFALTFTHPYDELHPLAYPYDELPKVNVAGRYPSPLYLSTTAGETPDPEQAVALFAFSEEPIHSPSSEKLLGRAVAYAMLKNYESALADLNVIIERQPRLALPYLERAFVYSAMADNYQAAGRRASYDEKISLEAQIRSSLKLALSDIDQALDIDPEMYYALYDKAIICTRLGLIEEAVKCYDKAIALSPKLAQAYFNRGLLHQKQGNKQAAISDWSRAGEAGISSAYTLIRAASRP